MSLPQDILIPTLWRTCRALANRKRLRIVEEFVRHGRLCVSDIVHRRGIPQSLASEYLRILNARGLLQPRRVRRFVFYKLQADPTIPHAAALIRALRITFQTRPRSIDEAFSALTGFTHPRRIAIVQALDGGPLDKTGIRKRTGIPLPSLARHLRKLLKRGYVIKTRDEAYRLAVQRPPLHRALLALALKT